MTSRRRILCFFALQLMLAAQLLMAQHATVHFSEEGYGIQHEHSGDEPDHRSQHDKDKTCQLCLFTKGFSNLSLFGGVEVPVVQMASEAVTPFLQAALNKLVNDPYQARAPPTLLS